ncbi:RAS small monomeric GTPase, putative [Penicillium digitatum PHI26]|uniref:RAS small monomeric GTPase, putative n=2 Tax=Penicillium digitatum TaxID=36651 RepID=K9GPV9_PEND2|nr:RAS small monomeric GTPase, putative [Penicillium digitatum Pd1]EKV16733.1 RAS small monomeric GTPase, putative [Penicillium digitatum PHI26]EKV21972.1 RAS small monomeric GTPase, putative [Penicillium digitatum Pd1]
MDKISMTICGDGGYDDSYSVTCNVDGHPYVLSITDTAGQEEYRGLLSASTLNSDASLLVYDITNPSSLETLHQWRRNNASRTSSDCAKSLKRNPEL